MKISETETNLSERTAVGELQPSVEGNSNVMRLDTSRAIGAALQTHLIWLTGVVLMLGGCGRSSGPAGSAARTGLTHDPVLWAGHGSVVDAQRKEIQPSLPFLLEAQTFYLDSLVPPRQRGLRAELTRVQRILDQEKATPVERALVTQTVLGSVAERSPNPKRAHFTSHASALLERALKGQGPPSVVGPALRQHLVERLKRETSVISDAATAASGAAYHEECRAAGVPIPPDWGAPNWKSLGKLKTLFISNDLDAEVYEFESTSPAGVCLALPRASGNTIRLLGIICLGTDTGKACFWDNQRNKQGFSIQKGASVPLLDFANGADLLAGSGGVCTDCHAGENPFVVHPKEPMDLGQKIKPRVWSDPLVHRAWPQNPGPTAVLHGVALLPGEGSCRRCHDIAGQRLPELSQETPSYCSLILDEAIGRTMPPDQPGNYARHIEALVRSCDRPAPPQDYATYALQRTTPFPEIGEAAEFLFAANRDLIVVQKSGTGSGKTEVHVLSASSNYQQYSLQTPTPLQETDAAFEFAIAPNRDIFAIQKRGTGSGKTEVHTLSAASNYQQYSLQVPTALDPTDETFEFEVGANRDLFAIKKSATQSGTTEVHVLTAQSQYTKFRFQRATALQPTDHTFEFEVHSNGDLYAISKTGPGSDTTEVHVLSAASQYREFSLQTGTVLHPTDQMFTFALANNTDLVALKRSGTESRHMEVHIVRR
ncbi:MAG TPA: hypothetical protein VK524_21020 [Polyangiaceae bacterium]|nr:hypothetical protein [Polyangiaceae bacterium]